MARGKKESGAGLPKIPAPKGGVPTAANQAAIRAINKRLKRESGAAVSASEMRAYRKGKKKATKRQR
jgi:hypothetical protein